MFIKKFLFLSIFCFFLVGGCRTKVTMLLVTFIKENCEAQTPCKVEMNKITPFSWDEFYFFDKAILAPEANKILGRKVFSSSYGHGTHKIVFFRDKEIVHQEEQQTNLEITLEGEVYFEIDQTKKYGIFPETAIFEVQRLKSSVGEHYSLNCINCN